MNGMHASAGRPAAGSRSRRRPREEAARACTVRFGLTETEFAELELAAGRAGLAKGAFAAEANEGFTKGGAGAADLAEAVVEACEQPNTFHQLYQDDEPIQDKIEAIATKVYGAKDVYYYPEAENKLGQFTRDGLGHFPICMAKTHLSLSDDPAAVMPARRQDANG